jgi:D-beta-D-heptose 7-phosphate kinase/D-beta-D-heptose 1-phosphate adenosyltransferase
MVNNKMRKFKSKICEECEEEFIPTVGTQRFCSSKRNNTEHIIAISGGMDPVHIGHVRMIQDAAQYGKVVVILNSDEWLIRKKGYAFMSWDDRAEIIESFSGVICVLPVDDTDGTVVKALDELRPDVFGNGGDRCQDNTPEMEFCINNNIELAWNLGGSKIRSSSELVSKGKQ